MWDQLTLCVLILLLFPFILSLLCGHDELLVVAISQVAPDGLPLGDVADAGDGLAAAVQPHVTVVSHFDESERESFYKGTIQVVSNLPKSSVLV